ncbi:hypothetical protein WJX72_009826 [[Myrmecia] bisecta]|uniref:DNA replication licensing factor MCM3 n=1 Tax=[Myrmecia] bisecta TaxID=41462 RepID=A0AAW1QSC9_9CHLO
MDEQSEARIRLRRSFAEFLDQDQGQGQYIQKINNDLVTKDNLEQDRLRLEVDLKDLADYDANLHSQVLNEPSECMQPFEDALEELVRNGHPKKLAEGQEVHVGFKGEFGYNRVSPRELTSDFIAKLVNVEGIVTKCSLVRPKLVKSVHFCEASSQFMSREYRDVTSNAGLPTGAAYPTKDENGNLLTTEYGLCKYRNHQMVTLQELPETAPPGQLPRSTEVIVEDDLVDACKPGDRVSIVGIYKTIPPRATGTVSGVFRAVVVANNVRKLVRDAGSVDITEQDLANADKLAAEPDVLEQLAASIAPSIYGHEIIKKGLILLLLGGRERNLANGTHLRGDINCLMVGDPGVAKSQLLRAVMNVAPLSVSTTGRGSSGVGLTAAVTTDSDTGERRLEAGAMVLADRGVVCIDEFDKMNDVDRVAIHEVMEQQTVTIAKAGIQTSLNARCSVVAAANPLYGSYDHHTSITKNINLPDSLLSRFDLLFIVLDLMTATTDRAIATHVLGQHRYRAPGDDGRNPVNEQQQREDDNEEEDEEGGEQESEMYAKYDPRLHGARVPGQKEPLTLTFLKKFITIVKRRGSDIELSGEAMDKICEYYVELRAGSQTHALPVTVRTLETIIRLSTAAAKARMADEVEQADVEVARNIMKEMLSSDKKRPAHPEDHAEDEEMADGQLPEGEAMEDGAEPALPVPNPTPSSRQRRGAKRVQRDEADDDEEEEEEDAENDNPNRSRRQAAGATPQAAAGPSRTGDAAMAESPAEGDDERGYAPLAVYHAIGRVIAEWVIRPGAEATHKVAELAAAVHKKFKGKYDEATVRKVLKQLSDETDQAGSSIEGLNIMFTDGDAEFHHI